LRDYDSGGRNYQSRHVDCRLSISCWSLQTSTHGKVFIEGIQVVLGVSFGNNTKELDLAQDLIIEGKVIAGDNVDTRSLLDLPMFQSQSLSLFEEVIL
jgi:hypothetical protein